MKHTKSSLVEMGKKLAEGTENRVLMREFLEATGVSDATIRRRFGSWAEFSKAFQGEVDDPLTRHRDVKEKRDARKELRAVVKALEHRNAELEEANAFLMNIEDATDAACNAKPIRRLRRKTILPEATYVMMASDWHMGERVRPEMVQGLNEYNPEIAQERAERYFRSNLVMLRAARSAWEVNQVLLWLGGDLMTGYIHEEYEEENFLSPTEESLLAFDVLFRGIDYMLDEYDVERVLVFTNQGNHGRTGRKKRITSYFRNSYEYMLYQMLAKHFKNSTRVDFQIGQGYHNIVDIYGYKIRGSHGDAITHRGGIGGIAPALYRRIGRQGEGGDTVDLDIMGHFHQLQFPRRVVMNGSLIGWNAFGDWIGAASELPMQASFVIDAKHKIPSNFNPIFVTGSKK